MDNRPTIALHGSYFGHNFGDILLMMIYTKWIQELGFNVELPFTSEENNKVIGADGNFGFNSLKRAEALVYGGGGYFGEKPSGKLRWGFRNIKRHYPAGAFARMQKKPYAIIGVGAGPITNRLTRELFVSLCSNAEILAVRDEESKDYLISYGVKPDNILVTADAVIQLNKKDIDEEYLLEAEKIIEGFPFPIKIGAHLAGVNDQHYIVKDLLKFMRKNPDIGVILLSDSPKVMSINKKINEKIPNQSVVVPYKHPWILSAILSSLDLVITTKLHVGITSIALKTPVLSIPIHPKTPRFFKQINMDEFCIPLNDLHSGEMFNRLSSITHDTPTINIDENLISASARNKSLTEKFLRALR